jgi:hypothetical protein
MIKNHSHPEKAAIDDEKINDNLRLITVDSQWFLEDWNKTPTINDDCSIKSREEELESVLSKTER